MGQELMHQSEGKTSRVSDLAIENFLMPNEIVRYATRGRLYVGTMPGLKGYVTKNRVIFHKRDGFIIKNESFNEIPMEQITSYKIVEDGLVFKNMYIQLNELKIKGDRSDILKLYGAIQTAKLK